MPESQKASPGVDLVNALLATSYRRREAFVGFSAFEEGKPKL